MLITALLWALIKYILPPKLSSLSPGEAYELFYRARRQGNIKLIKQLHYFPPETSSEEREKIANELKYTQEHHALENFYGIREKVTYEKIISEDTAIVGISIVRPFLYHIWFFFSSLSFETLKTPSIPEDEIIMKRENGIWKYYLSLRDLRSSGKECLEFIKKFPKEPCIYYYLGEKYYHPRPVRTVKYWEKYLKLAPNGMWAQEIKRDIEDEKEFIKKKYANPEALEKKILANVKKFSPDTILEELWRLAYFYSDTGQKDKAKKCLEKSFHFLSSCDFDNLYLPLIDNADIFLPELLIELGDFKKLEFILKKIYDDKRQNYKLPPFEQWKKQKIEEAKAFIEIYEMVKKEEQNPSNYGNS